MYSTDRQREGCEILYLLFFVCSSGGLILGVSIVSVSKGHCFKARVTKSGIAEILKEQQEGVKGNALKFYFYYKRIRLEYMSVQGRALLIYCYLMTMIIVSRLFLLLEKKDFLLHLCVFFMMFL